MKVVQTFVIFFLGVVLWKASAQIRQEARWCTINSYEMAKCTELQLAIQSRILANRTYPIGITKRYDDLPEFKCIPGTDQYDCMEKISQGDAHLMQLETGLSYTAGEYYNMLPLVAEQYVLSAGDEGLSYYAVVVARTSNPGLNINTLKGARACMTGVGRAAGWIYPISTLLSMELMDIVECNVPVKSAAAFFGDMCAPDGLARFYNPFGNNPVTVCQVCKGTFYEHCTVNDPYADYSGSMNCLFNGDADVAFVRNSSLVEALSHTNLSLTVNVSGLQFNKMEMGSDVEWVRDSKKQTERESENEKGRESDKQREGQTQRERVTKRESVREKNIQTKRMTMREED